MLRKGTEVKNSDIGILFLHFSVLFTLSALLAKDYLGLVCRTYLTPC